MCGRPRKGLRVPVGMNTAFYGMSHDICKTSKDDARRQLVMMRTIYRERIKFLTRNPEQLSENFTVWRKRQWESVFRSPEVDRTASLLLETIHQKRRSGSCFTEGLVAPFSTGFTSVGTRRRSVLSGQSKGQKISAAFTSRSWIAPKAEQVFLDGTRVMINCCVWRGQEEKAYPDGRQDHQPFLKEWIRHGK